MKYLKLYESFSSVRYFYIITTEDEKHFLWTKGTPSAKNQDVTFNIGSLTYPFFRLKPDDKLTMGNISRFSFPTKKEAEDYLMKINTYLDGELIDINLKDEDGFKIGGKGKGGGYDFDNGTFYDSEWEYEHGHDEITNTDIPGNDGTYVAYALRGIKNKGEGLVINIDTDKMDIHKGYSTNDKFIPYKGKLKIKGIMVGMMPADDYVNVQPIGSAT